MAQTWLKIPTNPILTLAYRVEWTPTPFRELQEDTGVLHNTKLSA